MIFQKIYQIQFGTRLLLLKWSVFNTHISFALKAAIWLGLLSICASSIAVPVYGTPTYYSFVSENPVGNNATFIGMFVVQEDALIDGYRYGVQNFSTTADDIVQARALAEIYETPIPNMGTFAPPGTCGTSCWSFKSNTFTDGSSTVYYTLQDINQPINNSNYQGLLTLYDSNTNLQIGVASLANIAYSSGPDNPPNSAGYQAYINSLTIAPEMNGKVAPKIIFLLCCLFLIFTSRKFSLNYLSIQAMSNE